MTLQSRRWPVPGFRPAECTHSDRICSRICSRICRRAFQIQPQPPSGDDRLVCGWGRGASPLHPEDPPLLPLSFLPLRASALLCPPPLQTRPLSPSRNLLILGRPGFNTLRCCEAIVGQVSAGAVWDFSRWAGLCTQLSLVGPGDGRAAGPGHALVSAEALVASPSTAGSSLSLRDCGGWAVKVEGRREPAGQGERGQTLGGHTTEPLSYVPACGPITLGHNDPLFRACGETRPLHLHLGPLDQVSPAMLTMASGKVTQSGPGG